MMKHRLLTLALLLTQALIFAIATDTIAFPLVVAAGAIVAVSGAVSFPLTPRWKATLFAAMAAGLFVKYQVDPFWARLHQTIFPVREYAIMHAVAQFLLLAQLIELVFPAARAKNAASFRIVLYAAGAMVCILDFVAIEKMHKVLLAPTALFGLLLVLYLASAGPATVSKSRSWMRTALAGTVVVLGLAVGATGAVALYGGINQLDVLLAKWVMTVQPLSKAGFSRKATLDSVQEHKDRESDRVVLRVETIGPDSEPGYLRALAFDTYTGREWKRPNDSRVISPTSDVPVGGESEGNWFSLRHGSDTSLRTLTVWPDTSIADVLFLPFDTLLVNAAVPNLNVDSTGAVDLVALPPGKSYRAVTGRPVVSVLADEDRARFTALPDSLDPRIAALAQSVIGNATSPREKAKAVEAYFLNEYEYRVGIHVPRNEDPLTFFLLEKPAAHCEYFAAGAAVLLRLGGVPCRYVTGFVAAERSPFGDYWIARNKDAHAWVEAWDDETGCFVVEATPGAGVPSARNRSWIKGMLDAIRFAPRTFFRALLGNGPDVIPTAAQSAGWILLVAIITGTAWILVRHLKRRVRRQRPRPEIVALHRQLRAMDRRLKKQGFRRNPEETIWQFAQRLEKSGLAEEARSYRQYVCARFGRVHGLVVVYHSKHAVR